MNIKDPEVHRLALELARRRHTSMTDAVRQALAETLDRDRAKQQGIADRITELAARWRAEGGAVVPDDELYDEDGLPK